MLIIKLFFKNQILLSIQEPFHPITTIKLVAEIVTIFTLGKLNEHFTTGKQNISTITDRVKTTIHNIKWDHFDILASGKTDYHCKVKKTLNIQELQPALNVNVSSEKL